MTLLRLRDIMNNKVFYQHPNLMRVLGMHETVMEVMVNVLGGDKSQVGWGTVIVLEPTPCFKQLTPCRDCGI